MSNLQFLAIDGWLDGGELGIEEGIDVGLSEKILVGLRLGSLLGFRLGGILGIKDGALLMLGAADGEEQCGNFTSTVVVRVKVLSSNIVVSMLSTAES